MNGGTLTSRIHQLWSFPLVTMDGGSLTIGKILLVAAVVVAGSLFARRLSQAFGRRALGKVGLSPGDANTMEVFLYYALMAVVVLLGLELLNIPLTVFTLLGGAAAIGVGFGSQTLVSNFISGLILLIERPVRIGDTVKVDATVGRISRIGSRSTTIVTAENVEVLLPNKALIEKEIWNYTLSDKRVRSSIDVRVTYGSPLDEVRSILLSSASTRDDVLKDPAPRVFVADGTDATMIVRMVYWMIAGGGKPIATIDGELRSEAIRALQARPGFLPGTQPRP